MKKKQYIFPRVEIVSYRVQNVLRVGSELPDDPGFGNYAPAVDGPVHRTPVF